MKLFALSVFTFLFSFLLVACSSETETIDENLPANLVVSISQFENSREVKIQATADNVVEYSFFINAAEQPTETNNSGLFTYIFTQDGNYPIEVRAYAANGKYIKHTETITIDFSESVPITQGYSTPMEYSGYNLVWNDEFNSTTLNTDIWQYEIGTGSSGWGNNELQYYRQENTTVSGGTLIIEAKNEPFQGSQYTSSRIITKGKKYFRYGRIDIRALLPEGIGLWPALWMLGENISTIGWPACGEIDIMEMVGGTENTTHGTLHWDVNGHAYNGGSYTLSTLTLADNYHVFSIIWDENKVQWLLDDNKFHEMAITSSDMTEFHQNFFFIFNVAVGGNWPGSPDDSAVFPQQMKVDYVRVFQLNK